jgi:hypothetical protein
VNAENEWPDPVGENRLTRYNIAEWLRELVAMRMMQKSEAAEHALYIRKRMDLGQVPWPRES